MKKIAIFASGAGSNARKIHEHFKQNAKVSVNIIVSNKPDAPVLEFAKNQKIDTQVIDRQSFYHSEKILYELQKREIDLIVLAGFLWLVPEYLVRGFENRIINIHPALLPKFGGKGMYGANVHRAVKAAGETETGITIHFVNEKFDDGAIIFRASCAVDETDTPESIAQKVHSLEHRYFPKVIEKLLSDDSRTKIPIHVF